MRVLLVPIIAIAALLLALLLIGYAVELGREAIQRDPEAIRPVYTDAELRAIYH